MNRSSNNIFSYRNNNFNNIEKKKDNINEINKNNMKQNFYDTLANFEVVNLIYKEYYLV